MLYAVKCYWPGVDDRELREVAERAVRVAARNARDEIAFRGSLLFSDDELVLCLFDGPSRAAIKRASDRIGIPYERVMHAVWLEAAGVSLIGS
jgi:Protein of unknown function (DUF4242)